MAGVLLLKCVVLLSVAVHASPQQLNHRDFVPTSSISTIPALPSGSLCPDQHGSVYRDHDLTFQIECKTDRPGNDLKMVRGSSLSACISACATTSGCVGVSKSGSACYLKSRLSAARSNGVVVGAILVQNTSSTKSSASSTSSTAISTSSVGPSVPPTSPSSENPTCPKSNGTLYQAPDGSVYTVECYMDRAGNDMKMVNIATNRLGDCINACASTSGCVDVTMSGSACYMKKLAGSRVVSAQNVRGARFVSQAVVSSATSPLGQSSSTSSSSSTTSPTTSVSSSTSGLTSSAISGSSTSSTSSSTSSSVSSSTPSMSSDSVSSSATSSSPTVSPSSTPLLPEGSQCTTASQCTTGHCILSSCAHQSIDRGPCSVGSDCTSGVCNRYGQCTSGQTGVGCFYNSECLSSSCIDNRCAAIAGTSSSMLTSSTSTTTTKTSSTTSSAPSPTGTRVNGEDCRDYRDCASGACFLYQCQSKSQIGGFCGISTDCAVGLCDFRHNTCVSGADGASCTQNSDCQSYACNSQGKCGGQGQGEDCVRDSDCTSQNCRNSDRTCGPIKCQQSSDCSSQLVPFCLANVCGCPDDSLFIGGQCLCNDDTKVLSTNSGTCEIRPGLGNPDNCSGSGKCGPGKICLNNACQAVTLSDKHCSPKQGIVAIDCTTHASGGHCGPSTGLCSVDSCDSRYKPLNSDSGVICKLATDECGFVGQTCATGWSCSVSGGHSSCTCDGNSCRDQSSNTYTTPIYAFPGMTWDATNERVWYSTTCCPASGKSGQCYNQFSMLDTNFHGGQDPGSRVPSWISEPCDSSHGKVCDWGSSFNGGGFNWNLNRGSLDRHYRQPTTYIGEVTTDSSGYVDLYAPDYRLKCQTADQSVLYYHEDNPCTANMACQAVPPGGIVKMGFYYNYRCITGGQSGIPYATIEIQYPGGQTFCKDTISNIGYPSVTVTSQKCNAQWALAKDTDEIHIYYVKYPSGVVDYTARWPKTYKTTGDCQSRQWETTYVQS